MGMIDEVFAKAKKMGASDVFISSNARLTARVNGEIIAMDERDLTAPESMGMLMETLNPEQQQILLKEWELDFSYDVPHVGRLRCNIFMHLHGMGGVFRLIPENIPTLKELELPDFIYDLINCEKGLILVTGPTGTGKSTTLAAMINHINENESSHILTVEDPIEFIYPKKKALIRQRSLNRHTKSFANALKASLRQDPDIIMVGELRDLETISLAMTAAETGHLVFGTLHTTSAAKVVDRIIDVFPANQQAQVRTMLSESLRGVVAQSLFRRSDRTGRIAAIEILVNTPAVANLIRECKTYQLPSVMQTGFNHGMRTFQYSLEELVKQGKVLESDAMSFLGKKGVVGPNIETKRATTTIKDSFKEAAENIQVGNKSFGDIASKVPKVGKPLNPLAGNTPSSKPTPGSTGTIPSVKPIVGMPPKMNIPGKPPLGNPAGINAPPAAPKPGAIQFDKSGLAGIKDKIAGSGGLAGLFKKKKSG